MKGRGADVSAWEKAKGSRKCRNTPPIVLPTWEMAAKLSAELVQRWRACEEIRMVCVLLRERVRRVCVEEHKKRACWTQRGAGFGENTPQRTGSVQVSETLRAQPTAV